MGQRIDPEEALLVESYDEPPAGTEVGVVVTDSGRVLAYRSRRGVWDWSDLTDSWATGEFADQIRVGLTMLGDGQSST